MGYISNKKRKRRPEKESGASSVIRSALFGIFASLCAFVVLWLVASFVAYSCKDPDAVVTVIALCALYISATVGGFVAAKTYGEGGIAASGICGIAFTFLLLFASFAFGGEYSSGHGAVTSVLLRALVALFALVGGFLGRYKRKRRRPRR